MVATYRDTIPNLATTSDARILVQGFTGKASTFHSQLSIDVGTNVVGGTSPKAGKDNKKHLGQPIFKTVRELRASSKAKRQLGKIDAASVFVPPALAADAVLEAIEEEIPLIVAVAEGIPIRDQMRIHAALHSQSKSRYLGANSPGYTNAIAGVRMGIAPAAAAQKGRVGIAARSGTLSYEATGATSDLGLGQSYVLGVGGDYYPGTRMDEALEFFLNDPQTDGIILIGEVGGSMEEEAAELLSTLSNDSARTPKPIVGFIAGTNIPPGRAYGHSGAIWREGEIAGGDPREKIKHWERAGIMLAPSVADTAEVVLEQLKAIGKA
ncbi:succinyl-CoA ligase subunit alpha [Tilletiaria anomala UBC 951]|uniref:Succinyl-CoA ligase subunit alpha n=1 Tax=Tilletiaria anomala (strain ATCC 24038 / CBS 436.72 / UBC 951) TaxID=1037660 RepID=A0A066WMZ3_TILAU|nr:succinyl-CoA ligase subunit alpha [Tilletiaria anomala UBC 951]KDN52005.1 succinyl-CoA ligase subunit alpha [Tilletiaria anomala UBC 951]